MSSFAKECQPSADFQIITSDNAQLHVHRSILEAASPVFRDMLSVPQPYFLSFSKDGNSVTVSEKADIVTTLLSLTYPIPYEIPSSATLDFLYSLIVASEKYEFSLATSRILNSLLSRAKSEPKDASVIYAIGTHIGNEELIKGASEAYLNCSYDDLFERDDSMPKIFKFTVIPLNTEYFLEQISGWDYHRLIHLYFQRMRSTKEIISSASPVRLRERGYRNTECQCGSLYYNTRDKKNYWDRFKECAIEELNRSGPTSGRIFTDDFLNICLKTYCDSCCKGLLVDERNLLSSLKAQIDALPSHV